MFTLVVHTIGKLDVGRAFGLIKGGKISKKGTNVRSKARKKLNSPQKKISKNCLYFDTSFIQSFIVKFKVTSLKNGHLFLFCF